MIGKTQLMESSEANTITEQAVHGHPMPDQLIQLARSTVHAMFQGATRYGLTEADVVRTLLSPMLRKEATLQLRYIQSPACRY